EESVYSTCNDCFTKKLKKPKVDKDELEISEVLNESESIQINDIEERVDDDN
ncbi:15319_t:CDS:1, partial [Racocetra persica]